MNSESNLKIDPEEKFPLLTASPIVEAVIGITTRAQVTFDESALSKHLEQKLSDYPDRNPHRKIQIQQQFTLAENSPPIMKDLGWNGLQCKSADGLQVAHFNRDGFFFTRLRPYKGWSSFAAEALRLWVLYAELAKPTEIQRVGLRCINQIMIPVGTDIDEYLTAGPKHPEKLPLSLAGFLIQNTFCLPDHSRFVQVTQTLQPPEGPGKDAGLVLDIDTFTHQPFQFTDESLMTILSQLRWLKNRAFFGSLKPRIVEGFK